MLNLEWFRTFRTVYEKGSMTSAAEALFISQPGVSLHLSSLENYVGYALFERRPRLLIPTERGKQLYNMIVDPIARLEEIEKKRQKSSAEERPTVTLGMCFETFQVALEAHIPNLDFNIILEFDEYRNLLRKLEAKVTDLVVTPHKFEMSGVHYEPFSRESIVLVAGNGMDTTVFSDSQTMKEKLSWLHQQIWYGIAGDNEHMQRFWKLNFGNMPDFRPNYILPNIHSIIRSLSHSPGLAIVPDFLVQETVDNAQMSVLWSGKRPLTNLLYFAYHKNNRNQNELSKVMKLIKRGMPVLCS